MCVCVAWYVCVCVCVAWYVCVCVSRGVLCVAWYVRVRARADRKKERERLSWRRKEGGRQIDFSPSTRTSDRVERSEKKSIDGKSNEKLMTVLHGD